MEVLVDLAVSRGMESRTGDIGDREGWGGLGIGEGLEVACGKGGGSSDMSVIGPPMFLDGTK